MLNYTLTAEHVYLVCGHTDMRKSIDGLSSIISAHFHLDPFQPALFLFCGRRRDRIKGLLWEGNGFLLLYKRIETGRFQWPAHREDLLKISNQELENLLRGLPVVPPCPIREILLPKCQASQAVNYTLNHQEELTSYLESGRTALTNNICERAIRNFTIGRKNWLFCKSTNGAEASAAVYSLVETCKINHIDPYKYFLRIFTEFPNLDLKRHPDRMDKFLPWNAEIQETCK